MENKLNHKRKAPSRFVRKSRKTSTNKTRNINLSILEEALNKNSGLICLTGENGVGKTYTLKHLIHKRGLDKDESLFCTDTDGLAKKGFLGKTELADKINNTFIIESSLSMCMLSHGQNVGSDIIEFLIKGKHLPVIFIDEPETALSLKRKEELIKVLKMDSRNRVVVIASNCPYFILHSDTVFELLKTKIVELDSTKTDKIKNKALSLLNKNYSIKVL